MARALGSLPQLREALARGDLSYSKVRALTRVATPETEERLLAVGRAGTAEHVELIVRGWRRMDRKAEAQETTRRHRNRALHVYPDGDGMVVIRGRLEPEVGAVVMQALTAAREALSGRRGRPLPRNGSRRSRRALPGGRSCRRAGARRRRCPGPVGARRRCARSRRNVSASGVRCEPRRDATRCRWPNYRSWRAHAHDPACATARAPASRQRLPLPRLWSAVGSGPSHPPLGARRPDDAVQSHDALSPTPSRGPRRGFPARATGR